MEPSSVISLIQHSFLLPVLSSIRGFCALVSGSMRAAVGAGGGGLTPGAQMILLILLTVLVLAPTSFPCLSPRSLHPFLPPFISRAVEITCPLARAHHQSHDSLRVATVMAAALIESRGRMRLCLCLDTVVRAWEMTSEWKVYFFNLLKAACLSALHLVHSRPPLSVSLLAISRHITHALQGWSGVCLTLPPLFSFLFWQFISPFSAKC